MSDNKLNDFYDYLLKHNHAEDALEIIGSMHEYFVKNNPSLNKNYGGIPDSIETNSDLYKQIKEYVRFLNSTEKDNHYVYDHSKNCRTMIESNKEFFESLANWENPSISAYKEVMERLDRRQKQWWETYWNISVNVAFKDKDGKCFNGTTPLFQLLCILFLPKNMESTYDEIKIYLEVMKNE